MRHGAKEENPCDRFILFDWGLRKKKLPFPIFRGGAVGRLSSLRPRSPRLNPQGAQLAPSGKLRCANGFHKDLCAGSLNWQILLHDLCRCLLCQQILHPSGLCELILAFGGFSLHKHVSGHDWGRSPPKPLNLYTLNS